MNIDEFVKEFSETSDKVQYIKKHIVEKYVPYEKKIAICKNIIESADYTPTIEDIKKKYYSPNTPLRYVLFCMSIIDVYTDIVLNKTDDNNNNVIGGFNSLNSIKVFEILFKELDKEYREIETILNMMIDDTVNKENNLVSFFSTKIDSFKLIYDSISPYKKK